MRRVIAPLLVVTALAAGCSGGEQPSQTVSAAPAGSSSARTGVDGLPLPPGSEPAGTAAHVGSATTQSYVNNSLPAEKIIAFYVERLPDAGWRVVDPPTEGSKGVWRADWLKDGRRLEISASALDRNIGEQGQAQQGSVASVQFSLVLNDDAANNPVYTSTSMAPATTGG